MHHFELDRAHRQHRQGQFERDVRDVPVHHLVRGPVGDCVGRGCVHTQKQYASEDGDDERAGVEQSGFFATLIGDGTTDCPCPLGSERAGDDGPELVDQPAKCVDDEDGAAEEYQTVEAHFLQHIVPSTASDGEEGMMDKVYGCGEYGERMDGCKDVRW